MINSNQEGKPHKIGEIYKPYKTIGNVYFIEIIIVLIISLVLIVSLKI